MKVRIKIRYAVDAIERRLRAFGERLQLLARQIAVLVLNRSKIVEDQRVPLSPVSLFGDVMTIHYSDSFDRSSGNLDLTQST